MNSKNILLALLAILIFFTGLHLLLVKLLDENFAYGYVFLFFSLFALGLLFLATRNSFKKISYLQRGSTDEAAAINSTSQIVVPGIFGLVLVAVIIFVTDQAYQSQFSLRNELLIKEQGKKIEVLIASIVVNRSGDSSVYHQTNYSLFSGGDISYSPVYKLTMQWRDSVTSNSYEFNSGQWTYDPTLFLEDRKSITVYVDPENTYRYYVDDSFLPDAQWKQYDTEEMRQELMVSGKGKRITVPLHRVVVDHHHVNTETPSNKKNAEIYCCYVMMAAWKNPASGEMISFKTQHFREVDPADLLSKQRKLEVYIDPQDVWRYYVNVSFLDQ